MTEHEANRYMNDVIFHKLVDQLVVAYMDGIVTRDDVLSAMEVADELHLRHAVDRALQAVRAAKHPNIGMPERMVDGPEVQFKFGAK